MLGREHISLAALGQTLARIAPAGLTLASDFGFCFQCRANSRFVLRRPIEITALIRRWLQEMAILMESKLSGIHNLMLATS